MGEQMKKLVVLVVLIALLTGSVNVFATGASDDDMKTIVFIPKSTSATFYLFLLKGATDKAEELGGYEIEYTGPSTEADISAQVDFVRNITAKKPAGILLAALDSEALIPPVKEAIDGGVPVAMVDSGINSDIPYGSFVTDQYAGGYMAGQEMAKLLNGKGLVANLGIQAGSMSAQRSVGFKEAIEEYPDMEVLTVQWTNADAALSLNIATDLLNGNPELKGFFSAAAPIAVGIVQALNAKGSAKDVKVITFDPSPEVLPMFDDGSIHAFIAQDPYMMGYKGVEVIDKVIKGETISDRNIQIDPVLITPENVNDDEIQALLQTPDKF
jgi:ribose transport system substrate-binding protein